MPTDVAIGNRRKDALQRIVSALGSDVPLELPRNEQRGLKMLHLKQLEVLADYVEANVSTSGIPEKYIKAEQLARENATKADIVAALLEEN